MATDNKTDLVQKYQTILDNNGLGHKRVLDVVVTKPNLMGEQMGSVCTYVTLKLANGEPEFELFLKGVLPNLEILQFGNDDALSDKEQNFFNIVLPDLQAYYLKNSGSTEPLDFFPKCLHADREEIIMENLIKRHGYHLNSKTERQDLEYTTMTLENLAQFHAVTYAMMKDLGENVVTQKYECSMKEVMFTPNNPFLRMFENGKTTALEIMNNNNVPGADKAIRILEKYGANQSENLVELVSPKSKNVCLVMNHGDFWNNNMLFLKDPVSGKLKHNIFVDFQLGRIGSPSLDLTNFIFTSVRAEVRKQSLKSILNTYYKKFCSTLELLTKSSFSFTFEELVADFKAKSLLGFWMSIIFITALEGVADVNTETIEEDFMTHFNNAINKWLRSNPDKARQCAREIVDICDEFEQLLNE